MLPQWLKMHCKIYWGIIVIDNVNKIGSVAVTVYVETKSVDGEEVYAFIVMKAEDFEQFTKEAFLDSDKPFNLLQYGKVLFCNMGKAPESLKNEMTDLYGYQEADSFKITAPCKLILE